VLGEVESFGCDQIGAVIGLSGDSVVQIATTARQAVTAIHARTGPECAIIREALAQEDRSPLAQRAVDRHLEHCAPCRIVAEGGATLGENLKKSMSKLSVAAVPFLLREGMARANVGGPTGSHAAGVSHRRHLRRRSFAAGAVGGLLVVVAMLLASTGRLGQDGQRTAGPWIVPALLTGMSFDGLVPASHPVQPKPLRPKPAPIPCSQTDCPPPLRPVCPDGSPAPCGKTPPIPPRPKPLCPDGTPRPCTIVVPVVCADGSPAPCSDGPGGVRCKDGSAPPCKSQPPPPPPPPPPPNPPCCGGGVGRPIDEVRSMKPG
jgi:hypothetical protein